jgi:SAM-dependent methyltransferase
MMILSQYFFESPYRIIRNYDEGHCKYPIGPYGETDFCVMERILREFSIPETASCADLGAGRGRLSLYLRLVRGQKSVLAVEYSPLMVERAERVRRWLKVRHLSFIHGDWAQVPLDSVDVVYLYGLVVDEKASMKLTRHMSTLREGTKIITISTWLGETLPSNFRLEKKLLVRFEWGETEAFLQTVIRPA